MIIVLSGMDGSGKSTVAQKLCKSMRQKRKVSLVAMKYHFLLEFPIRRLKTRRNINVHRSVTNVYLQPAKKGVLYKVWPWIVLVDDLLYYFLYLKPLSFSKIVVCDRFLHDRLIGLLHFGFVSAAGYNVYLRFLPLPKHMFILDVSPEIAQKREQGEKHAVEFYTTLRSQYLNLGTHKSIRIINTEKSIEEVVSTIVKVLK